MERYEGEFQDEFPPGTFTWGDVGWGAYELAKYGIGAGLSGLASYWPFGAAAEPEAYRRNRFTRTAMNILFSMGAGALMRWALSPSSSRAKAERLKAAKVVQMMQPQGGGVLGMEPDRWRGVEGVPWNEVTGDIYGRFTSDAAHSAAGGSYTASLVDLTKCIRQGLGFGHRMGLGVRLLSVFVHGTVSLDGAAPARTGIPEDFGSEGVNRIMVFLASKEFGWADVKCGVRGAPDVRVMRVLTDRFIPMSTEAVWKGSVFDSKFARLSKVRMLVPVGVDVTYHQFVQTEPPTAQPWTTEPVNVRLYLFLAGGSVQVNTAVPTYVFAGYYSIRFYDTESYGFV